MRSALASYGRTLNNEHIIVCRGHLHVNSFFPFAISAVPILFLVLKPSPGIPKPFAENGKNANNMQCNFHLETGNVFSIANETNHQHFIVVIALTFIPCNIVRPTTLAIMKNVFCHRHTHTHTHITQSHSHELCNEPYVNGVRIIVLVEHKCRESLEMLSPRMTHIQRFGATAHPK